MNGLPHALIILIAFTSAFQGCGPLAARILVPGTSARMNSTTWFVMAGRQGAWIRQAGLKSERLTSPEHPGRST